MDIATIFTVLESKKLFLQTKGNPLTIPFSIDEIEVLADQNQLRCLKLKYPFPFNFQCSDNLFQSAEKIICEEDSSLYWVLEFCVLRHHLLEAPVKEIFPNIVKEVSLC